MAKKRKTAKRAPARTASKRTSATSMGEMFNPSGWLASLIGSQTGRVIMAEVLVAAAGAAAAVLVASRTEAGAKAGQSLAKAGRDSANVMREAAKSAAAAAGDVIASMGTEAIGNAAKSMLSGDHEDAAVTQRDLAKKAMRVRQTNAARTETH
jgi:hypothetical protein